MGTKTAKSVNFYSKNLNIFWLAFIVASLFVGLILVQQSQNINEHAATIKTTCDRGSKQTRTLSCVDRRTMVIFNLKQTRYCLRSSWEPWSPSVPWYASCN